MRLLPNIPTQGQGLVPARNHLSYHRAWDSRLSKKSITNRPVASCQNTAENNAELERAIDVQKLVTDIANQKRINLCSLIKHSTQFTYFSKIEEWIAKSQEAYFQEYLTFPMKNSVIPLLVKILGSHDCPKKMPIYTIKKPSILF